MINLNQINHLKRLMGENRFNEALSLIENLCNENYYSPYLWNVRARLEMLQGGSDGDPFGNAEKYLRIAFEINPDDLEVLEELAHFYDVLVPDREKSVRFATMVSEKVGLLQRDMRKILEDS